MQESFLNNSCLYGTYLDPSAKALIQPPKAKRLLLILAPSRNRARPREEVAEPRSDPAKSIRDILATLTSAESPAAFPEINKLNIL